MDYEQKYKEALGWMQSLYDGLHGATKEDAEHYFPELKESEDERIRKALIEACKQSLIVGGFHKDKVIAWLEKQGEKVEPIESFNSEFERQISQLIASTINKEHEYTEAFVKWTSDAFLNYAKRELEKQAGRKSSWSEEDENNVTNILKVFSWYFSKLQEKTLWPGEKEKAICFLKSLKDRVQPKPKEWSEEDENWFNEVWRCVSKEYPLANSYIFQWLKNRLKSLRPQNRWKPSEKQLKSIRDCALNANIGAYTRLVLDELYQDLKKLREE